jgi:signal transduction histidine kinase
MAEFSEDYRKFTDYKFQALENRMDREFNHVSEKLENILVEVRKTNGRVNDLESEIIWVKTHRIEGCPQNYRIADLEKKWDKNEQLIADMSFILRNPKTIISGIVLAIIIATLSVLL